jgi:hypothetical protein
LTKQRAINHKFVAVNLKPDGVSKEAANSHASLLGHLKSWVGGFLWDRSEAKIYIYGGALRVKKTRSPSSVVDFVSN